VPPEQLPPSRSTSRLRLVAEADAVARLRRREPLVRVPQMASRMIQPAAA